MRSVTKEFSWDMAHMLAGHQGQCINIHGHTYKMHVTVQTDFDALDDMDMIVDFKELKEIVKEVVVDPLDHAFVYWEKSPDPVEQAVASVLSAHGRKVYVFPSRSTAERMASFFLDKLNQVMLDRHCKFFVTKLTLWETPTSFAEVSNYD